MHLVAPNRSFVGSIIAADPLNTTLFTLEPSPRWPLRSTLPVAVSPPGSQIAQACVTPLTPLSGGNTPWPPQASSQRPRPRRRLQRRHHHTPQLQHRPDFMWPFFTAHQSSGPGGVCCLWLHEERHGNDPALPRVGRRALRSLWPWRSSTQPGHCGTALLVTWPHV